MHRELTRREKSELWRSRALSIYAEREVGTTFKALGEKYGVSAAWIGDVYKREKARKERQILWECRACGAKGIETGFVRRQVRHHLAYAKDAKAHVLICPSDPYLVPKIKIRIIEKAPVRKVGGES